MDLRGSVAVVTGGTGGLGQRICRAYAQAGSQVAVVYHTSEAEAKSLAEELSAFGPRATAFQANVTDPQSVGELVSKVLAVYGQIDVLVNDAAYNQSVPFKDLDGLTLDLWEYILRYNLTNPFMCIKAVAPVMQRQKRGRIVNVASIAGLAPLGSSIAYSVSKAALIHLTRCMAVALGPDICVNCVAPGTLEGTKMTARLDPALVERSIQQSARKSLVNLDDVADQVVALSRNDSVTGQTIVVDNGWIFH